MRIGALLLATGLLNVTNLSAQQPLAWPQDQVSAAANSISDSTVARPKTKGGLFAKAKKLAGSKVVQTVTKTAACTMVPGGQAIVGAIDAASSKNAGEAAQGAAGAASRSSCLPGMGQGLGAGTAQGSAAARAALPTGMPMSGQMSAQMLSARMQMAGTGQGAESPGIDAEATGTMLDEEAMAVCLGITQEEYRAFTNPTQGEARPMTKDEMKRQAKIGKTVQGRRTGCAMQRASQATAMPQESMALPQQRMAVASTQVTSEAPGYAPVLGADPVAELKKGKTVLRDIDWIAGDVKVSDAGTPALDQALIQIGKAMTQAGGSYRIDIYLDQRYDDAQLKRLGPSRIAALHDALERTSGGTVPVKAGKARKDKDPRLEIVRAGR